MNLDKLITDFLKINKGYLIGYIIFMIAYPLSNVILPKYFGNILEDMKENKKPKLYIAVILLIIVNIMYLILNKMDSIFIPKLQSYIRVSIVKVVLEHYKNNFQEQEIGSLISKIVKLPIVLRNLFTDIRNLVVPLIFILSFLVIQFTIIDVRIGAITLIGIISVIIILTPIAKKCLKVSIHADGESDNSLEDISELFDNLLDIYAMDTIEEEIKKLEDRQKNNESRYKKTFKHTNKLQLVLNTASITLFIAVILYSYKLYQKKEISMSDMVNVSVTGMNVIGRIGAISSSFADIMFNMGTYNLMKKYVKDMNITGTKNKNFKISKGSVKFENVGIKYGNKEVIKNFNLEIKPKEIISIVGKIGSGKSSLIKSLLKLTPYSGKIYVDGQDIAELGVETIRSQILFIRQNPLPFNRSLYENIAYGNKNVNKQQIIDLFEKYNLNIYFNHNLDDDVGKKGGKLSGGQRQMIFLLRVLLSDKPIIILDEPTSSLDENSTKYIINIMNDIIKSKTVIIITHNEKVGQLSDRTVKITS